MSIESLQDALGHRFGEIGTLEAALIHSSFAAENESVADNERLEFLGDAVLQLAVTTDLFDRYPDLEEGQMAKVRAACVNREALAAMARRLDVGSVLQVGAGEHASGGRRKDSILADAMEAVLAAVYLDAGYPAAQHVILALWRPLIDDKARTPGRLDYKTRLQELVASGGRRPEYDVSGDGPDHEMTFTAVVRIDGRVLGRGTGRSKKEAQQQAAQMAIAGLSGVEPDGGSTETSD